MKQQPTDEQLKLVANHGSGAIERALAAVQLAKRQGSEDELKQLVDDIVDSNNE